MHRIQRQIMVERWVIGTFGPEAMDPMERALRLVEEAMELAQAMGAPRSKVATIFADVWSREPGAPFQEAGGVGLCLLACGAAMGFSVDEAELEEISRVHQPEVVEKCRIKGEKKRRDGMSILPVSARKP